MASFSGQIKAVQGTYTVSGPSGTGTDGIIFGGCLISPTANLGCGAPFSISAQINSGSPFSNITKLVFSFPTFHLISAVNPDTGENNSKVTLAFCYADDIGTSWTWTPAHPASGYTVKFFASIDVGTDTLSVSAYFDSSPNPETVTFKMTYAVPTMSLNFVAPSGNNQFSFGPSQWSHKSGGVTVYNDTVITNWQDANYVNGASSTQYNFGAGSYSLTPWQFYGNGTNTTQSNGAFYVIQAAAVKDPTYMTWYNEDNDSDGSFSVSHSTVDGSNNPIPCLYKNLNDLGPSPFLWSWSSVVAVPAGNGANYPAPNVEMNQNGVLVNYYWDNPKFGWSDVGFATSSGAKNFNIYYSLHYHLAVTTWAVWQSYDPNDETALGLPVGVKYQNWNLDVSVDNATAKQTLDWRDGRTNSAIWAGNSLPMQTIGTAGSGPYWVVWPDDLGNFFKQASTAYTRRFNPHLGFPVPNAAPMGGVQFLQDFWGLGLPRSALPGFGGIGASRMN